MRVESCGTVFGLKLTARGTWVEKILHDFSNNGEDGTAPEASLVLGLAGNLYGTTTKGGTSNDGTVFDIKP